VYCESEFAAVIDSQQYYAQEGRHGYGSRMSKGPSTIHKIREALNLMRNQKFEVQISVTAIDGIGSA